MVAITIATIGLLLSFGGYHYRYYRAFATIRVGLSLSQGCYHYRDYRAFAEPWWLSLSSRDYRAFATHDPSWAFAEPGLLSLSQLSESGFC